MNDNSVLTEDELKKIFYDALNTPGSNEYQALHEVLDASVATVLKQLVVWHYITELQAHRLARELVAAADKAEGKQ